MRGFHWPTGARTGHASGHSGFTRREVSGVLVTELVLLALIRLR